MVTRRDAQGLIPPFVYLGGGGGKAPRRNLASPAGAGITYPCDPTCQRRRDGGDDRPDNRERLEVIDQDDEAGDPREHRSGEDEVSAAVEVGISGKERVQHEAGRDERERDEGVISEPVRSGVRGQNLCEPGEREEAHPADQGPYTHPHAGSAAALAAVGAGTQNRSEGCTGQDQEQTEEREPGEEL